MTRRTAALMAVLLTIQVGWGVLYIQRTSFAVEGSHVFSLWDDAMISMRYARNLAEGYGLVWNREGERVQGISNPGVTLAMAGLHVLPVRAERVAGLFQLLNLGILCALTLLMARVALALGGGAWLALGAALAVALNPTFSIWALQGSDTGPVALWLAVGLAWLARAEQRGTGWPRGLFPWLACGLLLRLDFAIFYAVFGLVALSMPGDRIRRAAAGAAWGAAVLAGLLVFGELYYGDPLPNTFYLKATGSPRSLMFASGLAQLVDWPGALLALALAAVGVGARAGSRSVQAAAGSVCVALAYHVFVGGDWLPDYGSRHVVPVIPPLLLLATLGLGSVVGWIAAPASRGMPGLQSALVGLAIVSSLAIGSKTTLVEWFDPRSPTMLRDMNAQKAALGFYLRRHTLLNTSIAVHWAGITPYFSDRPAIDVLGRSDRHIARMHVERFIPGHSKWDWDYVLGLHPDVFPIRTRGLGNRLDFKYDYARVDAPGGLFFYLRKSSRHKLTDPEARVSDLVGTDQ